MDYSKLNLFELSMSSKNQLQEIYQKAGMALPIYATIKTADGTFVSSVVCSDGREATGPSMSTKKAAEISAAQFILDSMTASTITPVVAESAKPQSVNHDGCLSLADCAVMEIGNDIDTVYLIDADGAPQITSWTPPEHSIAYVYRAKLSTIKMPKKDGIFPITINSVTQDAADTLMTFHAGMIAYEYNDRNIKVIVVSKDHFADTLYRILSMYFECEHRTNLI
jgi:hypothetical protein